MRVGIMIEVPSAAMMADVLARYVDFFSIGTNDLTQYTIAVDRVNYRVASMFRSTHPGVIRLIRHTIDAGIPTAICGEMGGDITLVPLLVGLGATELSVGAHILPLIRFAIRHLNYEECRQMAEQALQAGSATHSAAFLESCEKRDGRWHFLRGQTFLEQKAFAQALSHFRQAEGVPEKKCLQRMEICCRELGDFQGAYECACRLRELE